MVVRDLRWVHIVDVFIEGMGLAVREILLVGDPCERVPFACVDALATRSLHAESHPSDPCEEIDEREVGAPALDLCGLRKPRQNFDGVGMGPALTAQPPV